MSSDEEKKSRRAGSAGPDQEAEEGPGFGAGFGRGRRGPGGPRRGSGFGRPGGWQQAELPPADDAADWFAGRLPSDWFIGPASVSVDREEIIVTGELPPVSVEASEGQSDAAAAGRISRFREETRVERMKIAAEAEARYGRKVAWGARLGDTRVLFTHLSIPVMTRLRQPERQVLDTLVDAGVARSRSEALSWAVNLVGQHADEWLASLREAMSEVDKLRAEGPNL
ncbi:MAG TPA: hypothetical protein VF557_16755 [Jatrophihabitans sp.]|jgi:hypothetical protein|uniref:hypothetical protein n=1 Tax=Jatrophihabitans sp. TaxID=1932789 RepID=UPI002F1C3D5F